MLDFYKTEKLLKKWKIPHPKQFLARNAQEAFRAAQKMGYPVVMKISSPDIVHKTETKGIELNIQTDGEARAAYSRILLDARKKRPDARIEGVLVQETASGVETIIGAKHDETFGPVVMFGLGGVMVEVLKDVSFRLIPITRADAREMIGEIKGYPILAGARGQSPVSFKALEDTLLAVSRMFEKERIRELDINPLFADSEGVTAADVRILV